MTDHIHEREAGHHLSSLLGAPTDGLKVAFVPTAGSWSSGIISVASVPLKEKMRASDIKELYMEKYKGEKTINVQNDVVQLIHVGNKHGWSVGGIQVHSSGTRVVVTVNSHRVVWITCSRELLPNVFRTSTSPWDWTNLPL